MPTVNARLHDAQIGHAVDMHQYANGVVRRIIALLNRVDADLASALQDIIDGMPATAFSVDRLDMLLVSVRTLNARAYAAVGAELTSEMRALAQYEAGYQQQLFESVIPAQVRASVGIAAIDAAQVYTAALSRPFQGRLLREWAASIEADRMTRIRDQIRIAYVEQETISQIVRRIRGTKARGYSDGIIEVDRRNAEAVVRTAIGHMAGFTRDRFFAANEDLIQAVEWSAALDTRTSEGCRIRDGKRYTPDDHDPIGHAIPWAGGPGRLHWNCRSTSVPITKSWRDLGVDIEDFSPSVRSSMDGTVPAEMTFGTWLKKQSAARQDDILGPVRGKLLRSGGLEMDKFYNDKGRFLSLDELKARDASAFSRAGLP